MQIMILRVNLLMQKLSRKKKHEWHDEKIFNPNLLSHNLHDHM